MTFKTQAEIQYETKRCFTFGTFWAVEKERNFVSCQCPRCAGDSVEKMKGRMLAAERSAHSLRGALTRAKKK